MFENPIALHQLSYESVNVFLRLKNRITIARLNQLRERREKEELADSTYKELYKSIVRKGVTISIKATDSCKVQQLVRLIDEANLAHVGYCQMDYLSKKEIIALRDFQQKSKG